MVIFYHLRHHCRKMSYNLSPHYSSIQNQPLPEKHQTKTTSPLKPPIIALQSLLTRPQRPTWRMTGETGLYTWDISASREEKRGWTARGKFSRSAGRLRPRGPSWFPTNRTKKSDWFRMCRGPPGFRRLLNRGYESRFAGAEASIRVGGGARKHRDRCLTN